MKSGSIAICFSVLSLAILLPPLAAEASIGTAYVGTVHGEYAFDVLDGGNQLYFHPQPDTDYAWNENNGSAPGTIATYTKNGVTADRDGMKTYAATDVAYGAALNTIKLQFDYYTGIDTNTGLPMSNPSMNFFLTDGAGNYGIWSATSGGATYSDSLPDANGWVTRTLDCTTIVDTATVAVYEHSGFVNEFNQPYTNIDWSVLKNFTIAGFYDYQRTPEGGFEAWGTTLWSDISEQGNAADPTLNEFGISINWGDTVGGMYGDGSGEIGTDAERAYSKAGRMIRDYSITVGSEAYDMQFAPGAVVPEPASVLVWSLLCLSGLGLVYRRRVK